MDYLRRSTLNEERHEGKRIDQFQHQQREVERARHVIAVIQRRLADLGVVREATALDCDWMDETKMPFRSCSSSSGSSSNCPSARGCHVPVQHGDDLELLEKLLQQDIDLSLRDVDASELDSSDTGRATIFDCFDSEGLPQGCHAHATQRLAQARFRVGCARRWQPQLWGWCGEWPWSHFTWAASASQQTGSQSQAHKLDVGGSSWHEPAEALHGGCTTLLDIFHWTSGKLVSYSLQLGSLLYAWSYLSRSLASLQTGVKQAKDGVSELQKRASGSHNREFVNRVSLSLNLLLPSSIQEGDNGEHKHKLLPRTLWERDLTEIMTDPGQRINFRLAAKETTEEEPFLRDSIEGSQREERKLVINLFSNHISSICSTNFILQDLGETVQEEAFVFGLTFEEAWLATATATGVDGADQSSSTAGSKAEGAAAEPAATSAGDSGSGKAKAKDKEQDQKHVKKIRVLMMREKMLTQLLTMTEDDIEFQSKSDYHKMRLKHLKLMATKWRQMGIAEKQAGAKVPQYDYIGKVRLCVPVSSQGGAAERLRPRSRSNYGPTGDPYDVTTPPDTPGTAEDGTIPAEPEPETRRQ